MQRRPCIAVQRSSVRCSIYADVEMEVLAVAIQDVDPASAARVACVYVGSVVGAGFASGREAWVFFARYELFGLIGLGLATAMLCILAPVLIRTARSLGFSQYGDLYRHYLSPRIGAVADCVTSLYLFGVLSIMFTGAVSLANHVFGLGHLAIAVATAVLFSAIAGPGLEKIATASTVLTPALVVGVSLLCIDHLSGPATAPSWGVMATSIAQAIMHSSVSSVVYVSYNMLMCLGVFASLGASRNKSENLMVGSVLGGVVLGVLSLLAFLTLSSVPAHMAKEDMPFLRIAEQRGGLIYFAYLSAVWAAMATTALTMLLSLTTRIAAATVRRFGSVDQRGATIMMLLLCIPISYVGFAPLMDSVYVFFGFLGLAILALVVRMPR